MRFWSVVARSSFRMIWLAPRRLSVPNTRVVRTPLVPRIPKVSGVSEKLVDYEETSREEALEHARQEAIAAAVRAGADESTAEIIDSEDVPLAYYPGKTSRIRVKAAGDLLMKH